MKRTRMDRRLSELRMARRDLILGMGSTTASVDEVERRLNRWEQARTSVRKEAAEYGWAKELTESEIRRAEYDARKLVHKTLVARHRQVGTYDVGGSHGPGACSQGCCRV